MASNSPRKIATNNAWTSSHFDRVNLAIRKDGGQGFTVEQIRRRADADGLSLNAWIVGAIREKLQS